MGQGERSNNPAGAGEHFLRTWASTQPWGLLGLLLARGRFWIEKEGLTVGEGLWVSREGWEDPGR